MDRICFMWQSATLPVSFCANRVMVLGCTVRSRRISRSRLYSPWYRARKRAMPCRIEAVSTENVYIVSHPHRKFKRAYLYPTEINFTSTCTNDNFSMTFWILLAQGKAEWLEDLYSWFWIKILLFRPCWTNLLYGFVLYAQKLISAFVPQVCFMKHPITTIYFEPVVSALRSHQGIFFSIGIMPLQSKKVEGYGKCIVSISLAEMPHLLFLIILHETTLFVPNNDEKLL